MTVLMRMSLIGLALFATASPVTSRAEQTGAAMEKQMAAAWDATWARFFHRDSQTFMDYLSSYEAGEEQKHLPSAEEVGRQFPNPCGYGTGMEDGMILGGAMLSVLCDRFAVTGEKSLVDQAKLVFAGMKRCATVHGVPGFVARNVCPQDGTSTYINSSRDQYTHFVHGLWKYYHSPLAGEATKADVGRLLAAVAQRMIEFVTPENNYDFCRADGTRCPLGICRMWKVQAHEAARLPMIYAAAWDTTGSPRYRQPWRDYISDAVEQSAAPLGNQPAYALLQMQASLELLHQLEPDRMLKDKLQRTMRKVCSAAEQRLAESKKQIDQKSAVERRRLGPDWRDAKEWIDQQGYANPQWGSYRNIWHLYREVGESALIPLMVADPAMTDSHRNHLRDVILETDYKHLSSCGIVFHLAAYWKARRNDLLP